jgi:hypothetical protein
MGWARVIDSYSVLALELALGILIIGMGCDQYSCSFFI